MKLEGTRLNYVCSRGGGKAAPCSNHGSGTTGIHTLAPQFILHGPGVVLVDMNL